MKRITRIIMIASALLLAGCSALELDETTDELRDYPIVDWYPVNVVITVSDKAGNDLLDPNRPGNYAKGTTLTFCGTTYEVQRDVSTKLYLAHMQGLQLKRDTLYLSATEKKYCYFLDFGEIDGAKDFDEDLVIRWSDGKKDVIHYKCSNHHITKQKDGSWDIGCDRSWKLNKKAASNPFFLVK